jgi:type VI secretion system protein ImpB
MAESVQKKLTRIRPPRVRITYDLEADGAKKMQELPFLVGIMADLSGHTSKTKRKIKNNLEFLNIDKENFNAIMDKINPTLKLSVENKIKGDESKLGVKLDFKSFKDFTPDNLAQNIPQLKELMETRAKLLDFQSNVDSNEKLEDVMNRLVKNPEKLKELAEAKPKKAEEEEKSEGEEKKADSEVSEEKKDG